MRRFALPALVVLAACQSETYERGAMGTWQRPADPAASSQAKDPQRAPAPEQPPESESPKGTVVSIPEETKAALDEFVNRPSTFLADSVEVDCTRVPWFSATSIVVSRDAVTRSDSEDAATGVLTITLQRNPGVPATMDSVPTVRMGGGLQIVGIDRVVLRFWSRQAPERPVWFKAVGAGHSAAYQIQGEPPRLWKGKRAELRCDVKRAAETYRFDWSAEATP